MSGFFQSIFGFFLTWWGAVLMAALDTSMLFFLPFGIDALVIYLAARNEQLFWLYPILATVGSLAGAGVTFWLGKKVLRFALVTTSRFVIGIVKAFNWFLDDQLKPFHPDDLERAFDYIEVPENERDSLRMTAELLAKRLEQRAA